MSITSSIKSLKWVSICICFSQRLQKWALFWDLEHLIWIFEIFYFKMVDIERLRDIILHLNSEKCGKTVRANSSYLDCTLSALKILIKGGNSPGVSTSKHKLKGPYGTYTPGQIIPHTWFSEKRFDNFDCLPIGIQKN